jgi:hypothetical protein
VFPADLSVLEGEYVLVFVGTDGQARGKAAGGHLTLRVRPEHERRVASPFGGFLAGTAEILWGFTDVALQAVGAYTEGDPRSEDQRRPGVVLRETIDTETSPPSRSVGLNFGSTTNDHGVVVLDGNVLRASIVATSSVGFTGRWTSGLSLMKH